MLGQLLKKYKAFPITVRAMFWFTICNIIIKGISFLSSFIFTRMIPQDEYGILSIFMSYEHILLVLATWEIQLGGYTRGLFKFKEENIELFTSAMLILVNMLSISFFLILGIFNKPFYSFTGMNIRIIMIMGGEHVIYPCIYWMDN